MTKAMVAALLMAVGTAAQADVIYETDDPYGGFFGLNGFDVFEQQQVGARFTPNADYTFDRAGMWFMSNDDEGGYPQVVTFTLRTDAVNSEGQSIPSETIIESWTVETGISGWNPTQVWVDSQLHPELEAGQNYWIVAESTLPPLVNPVWLWAGVGTGNEWTGSNSLNAGWYGGGGAAATLTVEATPIGGGTPCPDVDFNQDGGVDVADIAAFFDAFTGTDPNPALDPDVNQDGGIDVGDIDLFFTAFAGGPC